MEIREEGGGWKCVVAFVVGKLTMGSLELFCGRQDQLFS